MPGTDLSLLIDAALEAGRIAIRYSGKEARRWEKPDGAGPVTEADLAVNEMLEATLPAARPDYGWLSEETEDTAERLNRSHVFVIDPIDGTRSFAQGSRTWAHSLAVCQDGIATAAVVYLPQRDMLFTAAAGEGAALNGGPISVADIDSLADAEVLAAKPNLNSSHWRDGDVPEFCRAYRPSLAYRMALVAQGRFNGMLTLRPSWEWDIAAGDLIIREAGGLCTDRYGAPLRFNNPNPKLSGVVAGGKQLHTRISAALDPESAGITGH